MAIADIDETLQQLSDFAASLKFDDNDGQEMRVSPGAAAEASDATAARSEPRSDIAGTSSDQTNRYIQDKPSWLTSPASSRRTATILAELQGASKSDESALSASAAGKPLDELLRYEPAELRILSPQLRRGVATHNRVPVDPHGMSVSMYPGQIPSGVLGSAGTPSNRISRLQQTSHRPIHVAGPTSAQGSNSRPRRASWTAGRSSHAASYQPQHSLGPPGLALLTPRPGHGQGQGWEDDAALGKGGASSKTPRQATPGAFGRTQGRRRVTRRSSSNNRRSSSRDRADTAAAVHPGGDSQQGRRQQLRASRSAPSSPSRLRPGAHSSHGPDQQGGIPMSSVLAVEKLLAALASPQKQEDQEDKQEQRHGKGQRQRQVRPPTAGQGAFAAMQERGKGQATTVIGLDAEVPTDAGTSSVEHLSRGHRDPVLKAGNGTGAGSRGGTGRSRRLSFDALVARVADKGVLRCGNIRGGARAPLKRGALPPAQTSAPAAAAPSSSISSGGKTLRARGGRLMLPGTAALPGSHAPAAPVSNSSPGARRSSSMPPRPQSKDSEPPAAPKAEEQQPNHGEPALFHLRTQQTHRDSTAASDAGDEQTASPAPSSHEGKAMQQQSTPASDSLALLAAGDSSGLAAALLQAARQRDDATREVVQLRTDAQQANEALASARADAEAAAASREEAVQQKERMKRAIEGRAKQLREVQEQASKLKEEKDALQSQVAQLRLQLDQAGERHQQEVVELESEVERERSSASDAKQRLQQLEAQAREQLADLQAELRSARSEAGASRAVLESEKACRREAEARAEALARQLGAARWMGEEAERRGGTGLKGHRGEPGEARDATGTAGAPSVSPQASMASSGVQKSTSRATNVAAGLLAGSVAVSPAKHASQQGNQTAAVPSLRGSDVGQPGMPTERAQHSPSRRPSDDSKKQAQLPMDAASERASDKAAQSMSLVGAPYTDTTTVASQADQAQPSSTPGATQARQQQAALLQPTVPAETDVLSAPAQRPGVPRHQSTPPSKRRSSRSRTGASQESNGAVPPSLPGQRPSLTQASSINTTLRQAAGPQAGKSSSNGPVTSSVSNSSESLPQQPARQDEMKVGTTDAIAETRDALSCPSVAPVTAPALQQDSVLDRADAAINRAGPSLLSSVAGPESVTASMDTQVTARRGQRGSDGTAGGVGMSAAPSAGATEPAHVATHEHTSERELKQDIGKTAPSRPPQAQQRAARLGLPKTESTGSGPPNLAGAGLQQQKAPSLPIVVDSTATGVPASIPLGVAAAGNGSDSAASRGTQSVPRLGREVPGGMGEGGAGMELIAAIAAMAEAVEGERGPDGLAALMDAMAGGGSGGGGDGYEFDDAMQMQAEEEDMADVAALPDIPLRSESRGERADTRAGSHDGYRGKSANEQADQQETDDGEGQASTANVSRAVPPALQGGGNDLPCPKGVSDADAHDDASSVSRRDRELEDGTGSQMPSDAARQRLEGLLLAHRRFESMIESAGGGSGEVSGLEGDFDAGKQRDRPQGRVEGEHVKQRGQTSVHAQKDAGVEEAALDTGADLRAQSGQGGTSLNGMLPIDEQYDPDRPLDASLLTLSPSPERARSGGRAASPLRPDGKQNNSGGELAVSGILANAGEEPLQAPEHAEVSMNDSSVPTVGSTSLASAEGKEVSMNDSSVPTVGSTSLASAEGKEVANTGSEQETGASMPRKTKKVKKKRRTKSKTAQGSVGSAHGVRARGKTATSKPAASKAKKTATQPSTTSKWPGQGKATAGPRRGSTASQASTHGPTHLATSSGLRDAVRERLGMLGGGGAVRVPLGAVPGGASTDRGSAAPGVSGSKTGRSAPQVGGARRVLARRPSSRYGSMPR